MTCNRDLIVFKTLGLTVTRTVNRISEHLQSPGYFKSNPGRVTSVTEELGKTLMKVSRSYIKHMSRRPSKGCDQGTAPSLLTLTPFQVPLW